MSNHMRHLLAQALMGGRNPYPNLNWDWKAIWHAVKMLKSN